MTKILIVEDKESMAQMLVQTLEAEGYSVAVAKDGREGILKLKSEKMDLILTDLKLPQKSGLEVLQAAKEHNPLVPVILMTAYGSIETAVKAVKDGAYDFLQKPFDTDHLLVLIVRAREKQRLVTENIILKDRLGESGDAPRLIGNSAPMQEVVSKIQKVAEGKTTVLLLGESGTGKELFARGIHALSPRKGGPFVAINCAAIPRDLLESELFGHEKGSFTGATGRKLGKFELADKGSIFLDEIGDMDLGLQSKLLRVLQDETFMRVGGTVSIKVDVRVVAASNKDLAGAIAEKLFREDLFFRLSVFPVTIPPLRERREDIEPLAEHFVAIYSREMKKEKKVLAPETLAFMQALPWTGNVRELQNCIERAVIMSEGTTIYPDDLGLRKRQSADEALRSLPTEGSLAEVSTAASRIVESRMIKKVLAETGGNKSRAAEILQVSYKTLLTKIKEYGVE